MLPTKDECTIHRKVREGLAVVFDNEGNELFAVPESWADDQIWHCFGLVHHFYKEGINMGRFKCQLDIQEALGINSEFAERMTR